MQFAGRCTTLLCAEVALMCWRLSKPLNWACNAVLHSLASKLGRVHKVAVPPHSRASTLRTDLCIVVFEGSHCTGCPCTQAGHVKAFHSCNSSRPQPLPQLKSSALRPAGMRLQPLCISTLQSC